MPINKINTTDWTSIANIDSVVSANIDSVVSVAAPSTTGPNVVSGAWVDVRPWDSASDSGSGSLNNLGSLGGTFGLYNGVSRTTKDTAASWLVDGVNDYIETTANLSDVSGMGPDYTMESWIYRSTRPSTGQLRPHCVLSISDSDNEKVRHAINSFSTGNSLSDRICFTQIWRYYTTNYTLSAIDSSFSFSEWYHLVSVIDGTNGSVKQYVNGSLVKTDSSLTIPNIFSLVDASNFMRISIGRWERPSINSDYQAGWHGDFRVYNSLLNGTEITQNFNETKSYYGY